MSTHDTELEIDIDSLLDEEGSPEQDSSESPEESKEVGKSISLNSSLSPQDMSSMLKKFIHGNREELERAVDDVVEQNEAMRKQIALAARKRRTTGVIEEPEDESLDRDQPHPSDDHLDEVEDEPLTQSIAPSIYPKGDMTVVNSAMELNGLVFSFKPVSLTDAASAPSFVRGMGLLRLTPTFKSLSTHDMEEGVSPLARVGFIPLSGSLAMMRDGNWPEFHTDSMEYDSPQTREAVSQRIDYVRAFMEQNNARVFNDAKILDSWGKYTRAKRLHVAVTDDATYCLIEANNMIGDSTEHRDAHGSDGRVNYPYHRSSNGELNVMIGPNAQTYNTSPVIMLFGFSGGRDYLRALIQKENSNLLSEQEVEANLSARINAITQETMDAFINETRAAHGAEDYTEENAYNSRDVAENGSFLRSVAANDGSSNIGKKFFNSAAKNHTATCLRILSTFPKDSSELDVSGGKMTITRKQRININEGDSQSHKLSVDVLESLTLDSDRPDKASAITDFVVSARGVLRLQAQLPPESPIPLETKNVSGIMTDAREMAYRCANKMRALSYDLRNYKALREAYDLYGCHAKIVRANQNYDISRSEEDQSEKLETTLKGCANSIGVSLMSLRSILRPEQDESIFSLPRVPLTIMIEDPLVREGLAALMGKDPDECCVISTQESGENTLLMSDIHTIIQEDAQTFIDRLTPLFKIVREGEQENIAGTEESVTQSHTNAAQRNSGLLEM